MFFFFFDFLCFLGFFRCCYKQVVFFVHLCHFYVFLTSHIYFETIVMFACFSLLTDITKYQLLNSFQFPGSIYYSYIFSCFLCIVLYLDILPCFVGNVNIRNLFCSHKLCMGVGVRGILAIFMICNMLWDSYIFLTCFWCSYRFR